MKERPQYIRDSIWQIARALANLWAWSHVVLNRECLPRPATYYIENKDLSLNGAQSLNGYRIVITISVEKK